jgi:hypothetical protein
MFWSKYLSSLCHEVLTFDYREFLATFEGTENDVKDGKVTPAEFKKYYANLSSSIDEDDYFELMIRNAWHISGGEGWCENSSCRRVLVVHTDGRQTVEEIKVSELLAAIMAESELMVLILFRTILELLPTTRLP